VFRGICVVLGVLACAPGARAQQGELERAVEQFKSITRELGLREDSPAPAAGARRREFPWHGRLFENFRNDVLDAVPHEVRQNGGSKSILRRNQFGFNAGGPVRPPTYFSLSYEGVRENVARSSLLTVPTMAEREGDFSGTVDQSGAPLIIYDPATTRPNPNYDPSQPVSLSNLQYIRDPFPGNKIPENRLDPVAQKALQFYPAPNVSIGPFNQNNYFVNSPEQNIANGMIAKVDHTVREIHRISFGLSFSNGLASAPKLFPNAADPGAGDRKFHSRRGSLQYVFTASPKTVNSASFEAATDGSDTGLDDSTSYPHAIGLNGIAGNPFPVFSLGRDLQMGRSSPVSNNVRNSFVWTDTLSTRAAKHSLDVTAQYARTQVNTFWPGNPSGSFDFSAGLTSLPGIVNTGHEFASFLLGLSDYAQMNVVASPSYFRMQSGMLALHDSYEANPGLTFSLGLNFRAESPRTEKYGRQSTVDLSAIDPANGRPGALVFGDSLRPALYWAEPSASLAWNPGGDTKTVVRAGFSRSHSGMPMNFGQFGTQGFNGTPTFISPNTQLEPAVTLAMGLPAAAAPVPDLSPAAANDTVADLIDKSGLQPTWQSVSLSLERAAPGSVLVFVGASHSTGRDVYVGNGAVNPDAVSLDALSYRDQLNDDAFNRSLRPYPQFKGFNVAGLWPAGRYQRDSLSVRWEKRASHGLTMGGSYVYSKQMDDYSGAVQDYLDLMSNWALSAGNRPHSLSLNYMYELPLESLLNASGWARRLVDGWSVSGMSSVASGDPLRLYPEFNNTGGLVPGLRVNVVPGADPRVADPGPKLWFNPEAFDQPADFTIGNAPRTSPVLRNPIWQSHDLSVNKRFELSADRALEFSAVGLNFLNHANWNDPDTTIGPESAPNVNAGRIIGSRGGRVVQLGLRLTF